MSKKTSNNKNKGTVKKDTNKSKTLIGKKEETKKENIIKKIFSPSNNEMINLIKIIIVVLLVFIAFYFITTLVTGEGKKETSESTEVTINYSEILIGDLLEQSNKEYFVLVTKSDDEFVKTYKSYLTSYSSKDNGLKYYTANIDSVFNRIYKGEDNNIISDMNEIKFASTTLLRIKDKKIVSTYETEESILSYLKSLNK